jgi:hypothetical protein
MIALIDVRGDDAPRCRGFARRYDSQLLGPDEQIDRRAWT